MKAYLFTYIYTYTHLQLQSYKHTSRPANKLYCAKKYQNRQFVLQAGIYVYPFDAEKCTL